jgi:hypothetical protein
MKEKEKKIRSYILNLKSKICLATCMLPSQNILVLKSGLDNDEDHEVIKPSNFTYSNESFKKRI